MVDRMLVAALVIFCVVFVYGSPTTPPVLKARCLVNGTYYNAGESFQKSPCSPCFCGNNGQPICAITDCFFTPCVNPVTDPTKCCPTCPDGPNCRAGNETISAGKDHVIGNSICRCTHGHRGDSVALCRPNGCTHNGKQYPAGPFQPSACEHCQCDAASGRVSCAIADCFFSPCVDAVHKPDVCCPVCPNGPNCFVGNKKIPAGQDYIDGNKICRCPDDFHFSGPSGRQAVCLYHATTVVPVQTPVN
ncbi:von Willebrand factor C domain-containing protein 2-like [Ylistrum balloti]|uniref:von Willebrand factor C domain-containing protein 2-like n=1 Tax=Ylistrum balloti TaxID=509963 RepID=UPI002905E21F|nr:von Willebrand factor C domain-containing protein 2-like [Ylistrum balloti]